MPKLNPFTFRPVVSRFAHAGDADDCGHEDHGGGNFAKGNTCAGEGGSRSSSAKPKVKAYASGNVQGVGFRFKAQAAARNFDVSGYVRNTLDGRVEMVADGPEVEPFLHAVQEEMKGKISHFDIDKKAKFDEKMKLGPKKFEAQYFDDKSGEWVTFTDVNASSPEDADSNLSVLATDPKIKEKMPKFAMLRILPEDKERLEKNRLKKEAREAREREAKQAGTPDDHEIHKKVESLYHVAPKAKAEIDHLASKIAEDVDHGSKVITAPLKGRERALEKIKKDYNGDVSRIKDVARNTILAPGHVHKHVVSALLQLGAMVKQINADSDPMGYSGINAAIPTSHGITAEMQVNSDEMIYAKEPKQIAMSILGEERYNRIAEATRMPGELGHKFYEEWRSLPEGDPRRDEIAKKSQDYYSKIRARSGK